MGWKETNVHITTLRPFQFLEVMDILTFGMLCSIYFVSLRASRYYDQVLCVCCWMFSILGNNNGYFRKILGNYASEPFSQTLSYIKIYRHTNIWIAVQMELTLSFGVGERKIFNDFEKNNFKNIEYNYIMLVSITRLNSVENHVQWKSCVVFKSYSKCTMKFLASNNRKLLYHVSSEYSIYWFRYMKTSWQPIGLFRHTQILFKYEKYSNMFPGILGIKIHRM